MRIIKDGAKIHRRILKSCRQVRSFDFHDTIEINLDDFVQWYKAVWWRKEGGLIYYDCVPALIKEWLESAVFMSTDLEEK
jgi:hypothetical protein